MIFQLRQNLSCSSCGATLHNQLDHRPPPMVALQWQLCGHEATETVTVVSFFRPMVSVARIVKIQRFQKLFLKLL